MRVVRALMPSRVVFVGGPSRRAVVAWALAMLLGASQSAAAWGGGTPSAEAKLSRLPSDVLSARVKQSGGAVSPGPDGRFTVFLELSASAAPADIVAAVKQLGARIDIVRPDVALMQVGVTPEVLDVACRVPGVKGWQMPTTPIVDCLGSVCSEGDAVLRADAARAFWGMTGYGVRVGVISDGIAGYAASCAAGELPASFCTAPTAHYWSARADADVQAGSEGTAMMEIIADLAPDAELYFSNFETGLGYRGTLDYLLSRGCTVIADDLSQFGGLYDGTHFVAQEAARAVAAGVVYAHSAGNYAYEHYRGIYTPASVVQDAHHLFAPGDDLLSIAIPVGATAAIYLSWDDPFGRSANDYDLYLLDAGLNEVALSTDPQQGAEAPIETIAFTNAGPSTTFYIGIVGFDYPQPRTLDVLAHNCLVLEYGTPAYTIMTPADAPGVLAVATVDAATPDAVTDYSSWGPTQDGRFKPELTGVAGVSTSVPGFSTFNGTSAAAPHVAALAALVLELDPGATPGDVTSILRESAVDLEVAGPDVASGAGRCDALQALNYTIEWRPSEVSAPGAPPLLLFKTASPGELRIAWEDQGSLADGYNLYAGRLSQFAGRPWFPWPVKAARYDHGGIVLCDLPPAGASAPWLWQDITVPPGGEAMYFVMSAVAGVREGPTGFSSLGVEQDAGQATCAP